MMEIERVGVRTSHAHSRPEPECVSFRERSLREGDPDVASEIKASGKEFLRCVLPEARQRLAEDAESALA